MANGKIVPRTIKPIRNSQLAIRHSPFAIRHLPFAICHSLIYLR